MITNIDDEQQDDRRWCRKGHPLGNNHPNTYLYANRDGRMVRHCRTCRAHRMGSATTRQVDWTSRYYS
jgi:hypothetical protein